VRRRHRTGFSREFNDGAVQTVIGSSSPRRLFAAGDLSTGDLDRVFAFVRGNPMARPP
jgi:hypothetical protein